MGYTITEKILLKHTKLKDIHPGEFIKAKIDLCLGNDITAPFAIEEFEASGVKNVFDKKSKNNILRKIKIINYSPEPKLFELPTINLLNVFSKFHPNAKILYIHKTFSITTIEI